MFFHFNLRSLPSTALAPTLEAVDGAAYCSFAPISRKFHFQKPPFLSPVRLFPIQGLVIGFLPCPQSVPHPCVQASSIVFPCSRIRPGKSRDRFSTGAYLCGFDRDPGPYPSLPNGATLSRPKDAGSLAEGGQDETSQGKKETNPHVHRSTREPRGELAGPCARSCEGGGTASVSKATAGKAEAACLDCVGTRSWWETAWSVAGDAAFSDLTGRICCSRRCSS